MKNILTVDLEDWFSVEVLSNVFGPEQWERQQSVVRQNTDKILDLFSRFGVRATFFVLGWIADRYPDVVNDVANAGHEIGCHSYHHRMVSSLNPEEFKEDTQRAVEAIVKACGRKPAGYRSPSWGVTMDMPWAFEILAEMGFAYDSSIFPIRHDIYGDPKAPGTVYDVRLPSGKSIMEVPASTIHVLGRKMAIGGGGWLRQFPYWFTRWGIRKLNRSERPVMIYFHPWELDTDLPGSGFVQNVVKNGRSLKDWVRQYKNLITMPAKIEKLLEDFDFIPAGEYIASMNAKKEEARQ